MTKPLRHIASLLLLAASIAGYLALVHYAFRVVAGVFGAKPSPWESLAMVALVALVALPMRAVGFRETRKRSAEEPSDG